MERDLRKMINGSNEYEIEAILTKIVEPSRSLGSPIDPNWPKCILATIQL
jgi:hypothetical protein